jgi:hypothetical protein
MTKETSTRKAPARLADTVALKVKGGSVAPNRAAKTLRQAACDALERAIEKQRQATRDGAANPIPLGRTIIEAAGPALKAFELTGAANQDQELSKILASAQAVEAPPGVDGKLWQYLFGSAAAALWCMNNRHPGMTRHDALNKFAKMLKAGELMKWIAAMLSEFDKAYAA